ncbi:hypothetical protein E5672_05540 [Alteromonas portus]|uniref:Uncharacterized protein n=1 Tax=Alteromonas portus TaxID=2565549 RepID=A0A4V5NNM0_9ALTE|nr:hypothetical protein [Alteromonas portus]TKB04266.1 hypothetical protein E5672_05540 [Alteromonas portus]
MMKNLSKNIFSAAGLLAITLMPNVSNAQVTAPSVTGLKIITPSQGIKKVRKSSSLALTSFKRNETMLSKTNAKVKNQYLLHGVLPGNKTQ